MIPRCGGTRDHHAARSALWARFCTQAPGTVDIPPDQTPAPIKADDWGWPDIVQQGARRGPASGLIQRQDTGSSDDIPQHRIWRQRRVSRSRDRQRNRVGNGGNSGIAFHCCYDATSPLATMTYSTNGNAAVGIAIEIAEAVRRARVIIPKHRRLMHMLVP
jgi:hypothetical protein